MTEVLSSDVLSADHPSPSETNSPIAPRPRRSSFPDQRWRIAPAEAELATAMAEATGLPPLLAQVLLNRGMTTVEAAQEFLNPESVLLPSPIDEFPDLGIALDLLQTAIIEGDPIAICGDYDADGMTSTVLLLRALRSLGATVDYAIPSRMSEGYGINRRIVEEFHQEGIRLLLTVDNGIAAYDPIARARELGLAVIVTDHHDIPEQLPPANAILNPKLIRVDSPYAGTAGVGVAYILAICLAQLFQKTQDLIAPLLELFTLGTIADLAPLTGVNRRWVRRGLKLLPQSNLIGIQALIQMSGVGGAEKTLKPEAIGFRLGPRINAIGRISNPQIVIELLTTDDEGRALELAMVCEQINQKRQRLCELIEQEAIAWCETSQLDLQRDRVLVIVQPDWHHGVIGIVASRLVERYGVPVFIGTYEEDDPAHIRGSARGIPEFHVFEALQFCDEVLGRYGGHRAAGGFSLKAEQLDEFRFRLSLFANQQLLTEHLKPLIAIDAQADLSDLDFNLYEQIDRLHPCGIENPDPIFWTPNVHILEQQAIGRGQAHLKLVLVPNEDINGFVGSSIKAIAWRWGEYCPLPSPIDIAYRLRVNEWNGNKAVELELVGVRSSSPASESPTDSEAALMESNLDTAVQRLVTGKVEFYFNKRKYACCIARVEAARELRILNPEGQVLAIQPQQRRGLLGTRRDGASEVDIFQTHYFNLIRAAMNALELAEKQQRLVEKEQQVEQLHQQVQTLHQQLHQEVIAPDAAPELPPVDLAVSEIPVLQAPASEAPVLDVPVLETPSPLVEPSPKLTVKEIRQQLQHHFGDAVWSRLNSRSQTDLGAAYKHHQAALHDDSPETKANLDAAQRLMQTIDREIIQPFFKAMLQHGVTELGGVALRSRKKYTIEMLISLLWIESPQMEVADQLRLEQGLQDWQHPLAAWLVQERQSALPTLHEICAVNQRVQQADETLSPSQFAKLYAIAIGGANQPGILQRIYGCGLAG